MSQITVASRFQILSDGQKVVLITGDDSGEEFAFVLEDVRARNFSIETHPTFFETTSFGQIDGRVLLDERITADISLECQKGKWMPGKDLMFELDFFRDMTVRELFKEINKKLDRR